MEKNNKILSDITVFMKYAKLWELSRRQKGDFKELPDPGTGPGS